IDRDGADGAVAEAVEGRERDDVLAGEIGWRHIAEVIGVFDGIRIQRVKAVAGGPGRGAGDINVAGSVYGHGARQVGAVKGTVITIGPDRGAVGGGIFQGDVIVIGAVG